MTTEVRMTDPVTGGQKGVKDERFDLIPVRALEELARVYGVGARKYDEHNWRRGYPWGWSFGAMLRHAWAFWRGESRDPETGLHHLAHVAWHAFTLMTFEREHPDKDNRADLAPEVLDPLVGRRTSTTLIDEVDQWAVENIGGGAWEWDGIVPPDGTDPADIHPSGFLYNGLHGRWIA